MVFRTPNGPDMLSTINKSPEAEEVAESHPSTVDGYGEPPASITADTRGLPPHRAALALHLAWIQSVANEIAALNAGREKIVGQLDKAKQAQARLRDETGAVAASLLDKIKRGLEWSIASAVSPGHLEKAASINASSQHLAVAASTLAQIDQEIAIKSALLVTLENRQGEFMRRALREYAANEVGQEYAAALDAVRECMTRLEALERFCGAGHDGRLVLEVPGFPVAGHRFDKVPVAVVSSEVGAALGAWRNLAQAWAKSPRANPEKHLKFAPIDPNAVDDVVYDQLTPIERRVVDALNVA
jgi:hypothetical protein